MELVAEIERLIFLIISAIGYLSIALIVLWTLTLAIIFTGRTRKNDSNGTD